MGRCLTGASPKSSLFCGFLWFPNLDLFKMLGKSKIFPNGGFMVMSPMVESVKHRLQQTQVIQLASLPGGTKVNTFFLKGNNKSSPSTGKKKSKLGFGMWNILILRGIGILIFQKKSSLDAVWISWVAKMCWSKPGGSPKSHCCERTLPYPTRRGPRSYE